MSIRTTDYCCYIILLWFTISVYSSTPLIAQSFDSLYINELMPSNNIILDEHGETDDWVELYNGNDTILNIQGLYLSDDSMDLQKWLITESIEIPAYGYILLWLDDQIDQGINHAPFKLDSDGESVFLSRWFNGNMVVIDEINFPEVPSNKSYGRLNDGALDWVYFEEVSPLESNNGNTLFFEAEINFSFPSGFYESDFFLEITCTDPDAEVRWTSDDSVPTATSALYTMPIFISATNQIRAAAFKPGFAGTAFSDVFYLLNENHELPIIQVTIDPKYLWDEQEGIYISGTNGIPGHCSGVPHNWNQDWERPASIRYIESKGEEAFQVNAGIKIGGGCSRGHAMKPFNIFLREGEYGDAALNYPLFENSDIDQFKRFKLRASGSDFPLTRIRDGAIQSLLANQVDIDLMAFQPVVLYLNGEYWGFYGLREFFGKHYLAAHHGVDKENLDFIKIPHANGREVKEGDLIAWNALTEFIDNNDLTVQVNYEEVVQKIDINEFINYYVAELYLANYDWPLNNMSVWRSRNNGKWRWLLYDTDWSSGFGGQLPTPPSFNAIEHATASNVDGWPNDAASTLFLRKLLARTEFRNEFVQRTCTFGQTIFDGARATHFIDSLSEAVATEMPRTFEKFNDAPAEWNYWGTDPAGGSIESWENNLYIFRSFFNRRLDYHLDHFQEYFNFSGRYSLHFNFDESTNGTVVLHENAMSISHQFTGAYFKNVPLLVKAIPDEGYYFLRWKETGDTSAQIYFSAETESTLTPLFLENGTVELNPGPVLLFETFPNPAQSQFNFRFSNIEKSTFLVKIYNALGQLIYLEKLNADTVVKQHAVEVSGWSKGVYFLEANLGGMQKQVKFLVE